MFDRVSVCCPVIAFTPQLKPWEVLPSTAFWTSRSHKCLAVSPPPVLAFVFIAHRGAAFLVLVGSPRRLSGHRQNGARINREGP